LSVLSVTVSPPLYAEIKNNWRYSSTPHTRLHCIYVDNFFCTFNLQLCTGQSFEVSLKKTISLSQKLINEEVSIELLGLKVNLCQDFDVSLAVHLSITLANDQFDAQIFNTFITILYMYMFRAISCSSSGGQIVLTFWHPSFTFKF